MRIWAMCVSLSLLAACEVTEEQREAYGFKPTRRGYVNSSNVADVFFGDPLPSPLVVDGLRFDMPQGIVRAQVAREGDGPAFYDTNPAKPALDLALLPAFETPRSVGGTSARYDSPIVLPMSGVFRFDFTPDELRSDYFTVRARQPAYVQCLDATVLAGASKQDGAPFRAKLGTCTMSRSGGATVTQRIDQASCTTSKGKSDCAFDAGQAACVGKPLPLAMRRAPGDAVEIAWSGGDVPAGMVSGLVVPATVELQSVPSESSVARDLVVTFTGGAPGAILRMSLLQETSGSPVAIDCDVEGSAGSVVLPSTLLLLMQQADASLNFTYAATKSVKADAWEVEVSAPGRVNRGGALLSGAIPIKLTP